MEESGEVDFNESIVETASGDLEIETLETEEEVLEESQEEQTTEEEVFEQSEEEGEEDVQEESEEESVSERSTNSEPVTVDIDGLSVELENLSEAKRIIERLEGKQTTDKWKQIQDDTGVTTKDIALLVAAKQGDKSALATLLKQSEVDPFDLESEDIEEFNKDLELQEVTPELQFVQSIQSSPERAKAFSDVLDRTDEDFIQSLGTSVQNLQSFEKHIQDGLAQKILPQAKKVSMLENMSLYDAYLKVGRELTQKETESKSTKRVSKKTPLSNKASNSKNKVTEKELTEEDYFNMSDEQFMEAFGQDVI